MKLKMVLTGILLFGLSFAVNAQDDFPEDLLEQGSLNLVDPELILEEEFRDEDDWVSGSTDNYTAGVDEGDEVYVIDLEHDENLNLVWAQDYRILGNVVAKVDTEQLSDELDNGYGLMCRADPSNNGDGYRFLISGDGYASIGMRLDGEFESLADWTLIDDVINMGEDENEMVIVCVDDYLALYANGELLLEAEDDTFNEGVVSLVALIFAEDEDIEIAFDNLHIWEVESDGRNEGDSGRTNTSGRDSDVEDLQDDIADMLEDGDVEIELEDVLLVETWDDIGGWEEFDEDDYSVDVDDDMYIVENDTDSDLVWALNLDEEYDDIVMHVEIEHLSNGDANGFGLMCRVDGDNFSDGYSFLVRNNGTYSIGYWEDSGYTSLIGDDFQRDSDIDEDDTYTMTVVCVDEYLALYIDGELIDEFEDDTYDEGLVGVAAVNFDDGVEAAFDNLVIWEAND